MFSINMKPKSNKPLPLSSEEKKKLKEEQREKQHMNSMITRGEAYQALQKIYDALMEDRKRIEISFIQVQTLIEVLVEKELTTNEDLDKRSIPYVEKMYGNAKSTGEVSAADGGREGQET